MNENFCDNWTNGFTIIALNFLHERYLKKNPNLFKNQPYLSCQEHLFCIIIFQKIIKNLIKKNYQINNLVTFSLKLIRWFFKIDMKFFIFFTLLIFFRNFEKRSFTNIEKVLVAKFYITLKNFLGNWTNSFMVSALNFIKSTILKLSRTFIFYRNNSKKLFSKIDKEIVEYVE